MPHAYPKLEIGFKETVRDLFSYMKGFSNLKTAGRNGRFQYTHVHDMMAMGKKIAEEFLGI
jgi:hypothetical protein